jgi:vacuolar-type H+-ATPase subunit I/STV1
MNGEHPSSATPSADDRRKQLWEVKKLKAEVAALGRPWYRQPGTLLGAVSALIAAFSFGLQSKLSSIQVERAELKLEKTQRDIEKTKTDAAELQRQNAELEERKKKTQKEADEQEERYKRLTETAKATEQQIAELTNKLDEARRTAAPNTKLAGDLEQTAAQLEVLSQNTETLRSIAARPLQEAPRAETPLRGFTVRVYYRKGSTAEAEEADRIVRRLRQGLGITIQTMGRDNRFFDAVLPPEGNEVRYEDPVESEAADALLAALASGGFTPPFKLRPVKSRTPYFLSIFVAFRQK